MNWLNKYTWQQRNKGLLVGAIVFLLLAYQLSIRKTIALRNQYYSHLERQELNTLQAAELQRLKSSFNGGTGAANMLDPGSTGSIRTQYFGLMAKVADTHGLELTALPESVTARSESLVLNFDTFTFTGSFHNLLSAWNEVEAQPDVKLISCAIKKERNPESRQPELNLYITLAYATKADQ